MARITRGQQQQISNDFAQGLGFLVWWDLENSRVRPTDLRAALAAEGENPDIVPDIDPVSGLRRAAREFRDGRKVGAWKAEIVPTSDNTLVVGLLKLEKVTGQKKVGWVQHATLVWDTASNGWSDWTADDQEAAAKAEDFRALVVDRQTFLD